MTFLNNWNQYSIPLICCLLFLTTKLYAQKPVTTNLAPKAPINEWAVQIQEGESIEAIAASINAEVVGPIGTLKNYYLLRTNNSAVNAIGVDGKLDANKNVIWQAQQELVQMTKKNWNDPQLADQWHLNNTGQGGGTAGVDANVFDAWDLGVRGTGVQICIIDDGLEKDHEDLSTNFILADSRDLNGNNGNDPSPNNGDAHGTSCAGVAGATGNNNTGVSGVAYDVNLSGVRLIAAANSNADEATALTLNNNNNDIYSNSWGPSDNGAYHPLNNLAKAALLEGATNGRNGLGNIFTWAAGNGRASNDNCNYDGYVNSIHTIGVGAHGDNGIFSWYSEPGASMLISAPSNGGNSGITTTALNDGYTNSFGGTSSATPLVSGIIALMLEANPNLTWRDVQHILVESATVIDAGNADWTQNGVGKSINHAYGFGGVDAEALVLGAQNWVNAPNAVSDTSAVVIVNEAIPDGTAAGVYGATAEAMINIASDMTIEQVELKINVTHTYTGDLRVKLVSPAGTESILAEQRVVSGTNLTDWYFMTVRNWGENAMGDWTVIIDDGYNADTGTFVDFQLIIHGTPNDDCMATSILNDQTIPADTYEAEDYIHSNGIIATGTEVILQAGDSIVLKANFHAVSESTFTAKIEECTTPANLKGSKERSKFISLPSTLVIEEKAPNLTIYPNPLDYQGNLSLSLPKDQLVNIYLMDALGKQVVELQKPIQLVKGKHDLPFYLDRFQLNNGIYFVVSKIGTKIIAKKISLLR